LERAAITPDTIEKTERLNAAETLLLQAQTISPLNTDHTANLARLNTRWYAAADDPSEQRERLDQAETYYQKALALSPQNSVIRNEYARLLLDLRQDCSRALEVFDDSARIDPFFAQTLLARADAIILCAEDVDEQAQAENYRLAATTLEDAIRLDPENIRAWVQLAEIERQLGNYDAARTAVEQARALNNPVRFPPAEINFLAARILAGLGNINEARQLALSALATATDETATQIEAFLTELESGSD
jgi:tetratricopeptide (TPR) repeat protein